MMINYLNIYGTDDALKAMRKPYLSQPNNHDADIKLAQKLIKSGSEHRKFLRQIMINIDITASMTFWFEFDTYKIGTTSNSESFWNTIGKDGMKNGFKVDNFLCNAYIQDYLQSIIDIINLCIKENPDIKAEELRYLIPQGVLYNRLITMNAEVLLNILSQRKNHRLPEWKIFCSMIHNQIKYRKDQTLYEILFKGN